jgi:hypothetical protein
MVLAAAFCSIAHASFFDDLIGNVVGDNVRKGLAAQHGLTDGARRPQESQVFARIAQAAGKKGLSLAFVGSRDINAFAAPGDQVFVTDGLMDAVQGQEQELAFCLGHEVSHITGGDTKKLARMALAESVLFGKAGANSQTVVALAERLLTYKQSQEQEFAADAKAMNLLHKSGYDLSGGLALMRRLETIKATNPNIIDQIFATHPPTPERSARLKDQMFLLQYGSTFKLASVVGSASADPDTPKTPTGFYYPCGKVETHTNWGDGGTDPYISDKFHLGDDMCKSGGPGAWKLDDQLHKPIHPIARGTIYLVEKGQSWSGDQEYGNHGNVAVVVKHKNQETGEFLAVYGHIVPSKEWKYEEKVGPSDVLGTIGDYTVRDSNGRKVDWPHLHFGIINGSETPAALDGVNMGWGRMSRSYEAEHGHEPWVEPIQWITEKHPADEQIAAPQPEPIPDSIVLCPGPIHLGDDVVTSRIIWSRTFSLDERTVQHFSKSYVTFQLKATPKKDPRICINRKLIGEAVARLGDWQAFRFAVPPGTLRVGDNLIDLETIIADLHNTFDDCEIRNITLTI